MIEVKKYIGRNDINTSFEGKYYLKNKAETIGYFNIEKIDWICRWVKISVMIKNSWEETKSFIKAVMDYLYNELNLIKIKIEVFSNEHDLINTFKEFGFKIEGSFKNEKYLNGTYLDLICFSSFREDCKLQTATCSESVTDIEDKQEEEVETVDNTDNKYINTKRISSFIKFKLNKSDKSE